MNDPYALLRTMAATLDGLDVGMCAFDADDCTILWNRAFLRLFPEHAGHVHEGEPYGENLRRFYTGRLAPELLPEIQRHIDSGVARHRAQHRPHTFQHGGAWIRVSSLPLPEGGRVRVWTREATPRLSDTQPALPLTAADAPDNTEMFEHVGDGVMLTQADNRITWVNEHFVQMFALRGKADALDAHFEDVYSRAWQHRAVPEAALFDAGLAALTDNLRYAGAPFELPLPGGRWVRVIEQRRADGVGFFALVDITVLKHQHQELIEAEQRARRSEALLAEKSRLLEVTLERLQQGVMMINADRVVEVCNARAIELLGLPPELMAARPTFSQVLEFQWSMGEFAATPEGLREIVRSGGILDQPQRYERKRPNGRVLEIHNMPMDAGSVLRTYSDVTERRQAEAAQQQLAAQLREAQKLQAIGTLAGGIAHDFNNIIAAILGNVGFARESMGSDAAAQLFLEQIEQAGRRARSLVQQILAFSQKQSGDFQLLRLQPLIEEMLMMLRPIAGPAVHLRVQMPEQPLLVRGNATQLQQVLMNLGTNAMQALQGAAGHVEVGLEACASEAPEDHARPQVLAPGPWVHLWVRDDGCGMREATRSRIFEPFFTTKPVGSGTGLGLAVAHGIVEAHGGTITVDSQLGQGSVFHVYLPRADGASQQPLPRTLTADAAPGQGQHILYIDDDEVMAMMVRSLLERLGYRATSLIDAQDALASVQADPDAYDLVVTDYNMPRLTGLDVARVVASLRPSLPVLISSGYISEHLRADAAALGVRGLMQKEQTWEELGALVQATLQPPS